MDSVNSEAVNQKQYQDQVQNPLMVNNNGDRHDSSRTLTTAQLIERDLYNIAAAAKIKRQSEDPKQFISTTCNCEHSRCIKLYCECFSNNLYCGTNCKCVQCYNNLNYEDTVQMEHDRLNDEASSKTKGCSCEKSKCKNKHCQCLRANVGCSEECQCFSCSNPNGTNGSNENPTISFATIRQIETANNELRCIPLPVELWNLSDSTAQSLTNPRKRRRSQRSSNSKVSEMETCDRSNTPQSSESYSENGYSDVETSDTVAQVQTQPQFGFLLI